MKEGIRMTFRRFESIEDVRASRSISRQRVEIAALSSATSKGALGDSLEIGEASVLEPLFRVNETSPTHLDINLEIIVNMKERQFKASTASATL